jgi:ribulose-5-phosphate 4-epimerase/fuculose-1-phosphate aldolase
MTEAEWQTRCDLAALYRIFDELGMTYLIYTHLSARVPGERETFLMNRHGEMFDEVTASSLLKLDFAGNVIGESAPFSTAGFMIHSTVYKARPDVACVTHTHTPAGSAVSTLKNGLRPISQDALEIYDELGYHPYGDPTDAEECRAFARSCAHPNCVILRNHGLLTLGDTIPSAFIRMYYLERACQVQVAAAGAADVSLDMPEEAQAALATRLRALRSSSRYGQPEWQTLLRLLERRGADYRR